MIFDFPSVSSVLRKTSLPALAVLAALVSFAHAAFAAPLLIVSTPGAKAVFKADSGTEDALALGIVDADGLLLVAEAPTVAGTLTLTHPDAEAPLDVPFVPGKTPGKISPELKLRPASLMVSALPADEVEIFVNGQHRGRGAVMIGGIAPHEKITVEARSARRGMQSRVVSAAPGEMLPVKFDLRGNEISSRPDGQIVLPELPLVLASQTGAVLKADGAVVELDEGALRGLEPGERIVEIFLPWRGREVCVWRAAMPARSAMLPGADVVAIPNPPPSAEKRAEEAAESVPAAVVPETAEAAVPADADGGTVQAIFGSKVMVSLGGNAGLKDGETVSVFFGDAAEAVPVVVSGVTPTRAFLALPEGVPAPAEGVACRLAPAADEPPTGL